jgi:hypothetical protein
MIQENESLLEENMKKTGNQINVSAMSNQSLIDIWL